MCGTGSSIEGRHLKFNILLVFLSCRAVHVCDLLGSSKLLLLAFGLLLLSTINVLDYQLISWSNNYNFVGEVPFIYDFFISIYIHTHQNCLLVN